MFKIEITLRIDLGDHVRVDPCASAITSRVLSPILNVPRIARRKSGLVQPQFAGAQIVAIPRTMPGRSAASKVEAAIPTAASIATGATISLRFSLSWLMPLSWGRVFRQAIKLPWPSRTAFCIKISLPRGVLGLSGFRAPNTPIASAPSIPAFDDISKTLEQRRDPPRNYDAKVWFFAPGFSQRNRNTPRSLGLAALLPLLDLHSTS
jgi:hypothetical protein